MDIKRDAGVLWGVSKTNWGYRMKSTEAAKKPLSDTAIRAARPRATDYKVFDGHGLYLLVRPTGAKLWRLKYRIGGKEKLLSFGQYPDVTLKEAREAAQEARKLISRGICPIQHKKTARELLEAGLSNSFEITARRWVAHQTQWGEANRDRVLSSLERYVFKQIGNLPVGDVKAPDVLRIARQLEEQGLGETVRRVVQRISGVMRFAIAEGKAEQDPCPSLRGALKAAPVKHMAALGVDEVPELLRKIDLYNGHPQTRLALNFMALTFVRTIEMRGARWEEFDIDRALWRIPGERMKMKQEHLVPLSRQALKVLEELKQLGRESEFVFPATTSKTRYMSENTVLYALYRMGYHGRMTGHGFRSVASTILNESGRWQVDAIERQLAHAPASSGPVRAAYNRSQYWEERTRMMQWWADKLDALRRGAQVLEFKKGIA